MNHEDHVRLIAGAIEPESGGIWADFGAGAGAFTLALRDLAGPEVEIHAVDRDSGALRALRSGMAQRFPGTRLSVHTADFAAPLDLPPLDGALAANALHFARDQVGLLRRWRAYLKPGGRLVIVEYDAGAGNRWVPYPVSFSALGPLLRASGFAAPVLLATVPSRFLGRIYAAQASPAA